MILIARRTVLLALIIFSVTVLTAQNDSDVMEKIQRTKAFLLKQRLSPDYRDSVRKAVIAYEKKLDNYCKDVELDFDSVDVRDRILALLEIDDKGRAVSGSWKETVPGSICSEKRKVNVQVNVVSDGLRFTATFPGDAAGDPELQNDTLTNIAMNLQMLGISTGKSCHLEVIDTHLVGLPSKVMDNGVLSPWKESWDVSACGKIYVVPVTYRLDSKGTAISVGTSEIRPVIAGE